MWGKNQHQQQVPAAPHKGTTDVPKEAREFV